jgi:hypothetical protein
MTLSGLELPTFRPVAWYRVPRDEFGAEISTFVLLLGLLGRTLG